MAHSAILNHSTRTLTINTDDDNEKIVYGPVPVQYREDEVLDRWVGREVRKAGFSTSRNPFDTFDTKDGLLTVYRLKPGKN